MPDDIDADVIVTMRVADLTTRSPGSVERTCALCDAPVVVARSTFAAFKGRQLPPIWCAPCALDATRRGGRA